MPKEEKRSFISKVFDLRSGSLIAASLLIAIVLVSGCTSQSFDPTAIAKVNSAIKSFLSDYPNAKVVTSYVQNVSIVSDCQNPQLATKDYWKVNIYDEATNLAVNAWIDAASNSVVCVVKTGGGKNETIQATETQTEKTIKQNDKCWYISNSTKLTFTEKDQQLSLCYTDKYYSIAISRNDTKICDEISLPWFMGFCYEAIAFNNRNLDLCSKMQEIGYESRGYYDNLTNRDVCYDNYALDFISHYSIFVKDACDNIKNEQMRQECEGYQNSSKPATGIDTVYVDKNSNSIFGYIALQNEDGYATTSNGIVNFTVEEGSSFIDVIPVRILYTKSVAVSQYDFHQEAVGLGALQHQTILYSFTMKYSDFDIQPSLDYGYLVVRFTTESGKTFTKTQQFSFK
ncbi:MAG: hypothetical protein NT120_04725 [Candidatus Aenigmarchaeota archaeon]|nr:hypothetical protein [Candidatus Aenigmarchaeota archaeon]